jgi:uncharacterized protein
MSELNPSVQLNGSFPIEFSGQQFWLLPDKAVFWPEQNALLVADVHLGKANTFRRAGLAVPQGTATENLNRLTTLLTETKAQQFIVLGDWFHSERGIEQSLVDSVKAWRQQCTNVRCILVQGNHDRKTLPITLELGFEIAGESLNLAGIRLEHGHAEDGGHRKGKDLQPKESTIFGHYHPVFVLRGKARESVRLPVFWKTPRQLYLPSFGEFTGGFAVESSKGDELFCVGDGQVFEIPVI